MIDKRSRNRLVLIALACLVLRSPEAQSAIAQAQVPVPVSPGRPDGEARISDACPTFNWAAVAGARGYRLAVYRLPSRDESSGTALAPEEAWIRTLPATLGFTPEGHECFTAGGRYGWMVQALPERGVEPTADAWSELLRFRVDPLPSSEEMRRAVEVVQSYLAAGGEIAAPTADAAGPRRERATSAAGTGAVRSSSAGSLITTPAAIRGEMPATVGDAAGILGVSAAADGIGVLAANSAPGGGPDLVLDGTAQGLTNTVLTESGIDRSSGTTETFAIGNSAGNGLTLTIDGVAAVTTLTDQDTLAELPCFPGGLAKSLGSGGWHCDRDYDTLADLPCPDGQLVKRIGGFWDCAADADTLVSLGCGIDEVPRWSGSAWACVRISNSATALQAGRVEALGPFGVTFSPAFAAPPVVTFGSDGGAVTLVGVTPTGFTARTGTTHGFENASSSSLAEVAGHPAISYWDETNGNLGFVRADDANGNSWPTPLALDTAGDVGKYTSLAVVNGHPAISYYDSTNGDLKFVRSNDANGASWAAPMALDTAGDVGDFTSLAVVNGHPAISYYDWTNYDLKFVRANDADGTSWAAPITLGTDGYVGFDISLAVVNGHPAISYYDYTFSNQDLKFVRANDANGTSWASPLTLDTDGAVGGYTSLAVVDGYPAISYYDWDKEDLKFVRANDANGDSWAAPVALDTNGDVGRNTSLAVVNGHPAISYTDWTNGNGDLLKFVHANDASGASWAAPVTLDAALNVGGVTSLAVVNGHPAISYTDWTNGNGDVKFLAGATVHWMAVSP